MYYIGRKKLPLDRPFSDEEGFQYPADWLRHSTKEQRDKLNITERINPNLKKAVVDPPKYTKDQLQHFREMECYTQFVSGVMLGVLSNLTMTVDQVKEEVQLFTLDNIKTYPCSRSLVDQFYTMWQRFGPDAARTAMIPYVWNGVIPAPSEYLNGKA